MAKLEDHLYDEGLDGADALEISQQFQEAKDRLLQKVSEAKAARDRGPPAPPVAEAPAPTAAQVPTVTVWATAATSRAFLESLGQQVPEDDEEARNAAKRCAEAHQAATLAAKRAKIDDTEGSQQSKEAVRAAGDDAEARGREAVAGQPTGAVGVPPAPAAPAAVSGGQQHP